MTLNHSPAAQKRRPRSDARDITPECQEVLRSLWDYREGNRGRGLADRVGAHLSACAACSRRREAEERFFASLAAMRDRSPAPARVHHRVRRALAAERLQGLAR